MEKKVIKLTHSQIERERERERERWRGRKVKRK